MSDYVHGRYVLRGAQDIAFVDVEGESDRFEQYFSFFPRHSYLRFDRRAPSFLQAWLPWGRELANPFYYSSLTPKAEADELYRRVLGRFADEARQTVFLSEEEVYADLATGVPGRIEWGFLSAPSHFPYRRPHWHMSRAGNEWVARAYFAVLLGRPAIDAEEIRLTDSATGAPNGPGAVQALSASDRLTVRLGTQSAGALVHRGSSASSLTEDRVDPHGEGIRSILSLTPPDGSFLDALMAPLDFDLRSGAVIELIEDSGDRPRVWKLGEVVLPNARIQVGYARIPGIQTAVLWENGNDETLCLDGSALGIPSSVRGTIRVDNLPTWTLAPKSSQCPLALSAIGRPLVFVKPLADTPLDTSALPESGDVSLDLPGLGDNFAIGAFEKHASSIPYSHGGPRQVIRADGALGRLESQP
jgi:hypothetical protein